MARLISLIVLTVLIVFLGLTFYSVIAPFLLPLFLAGVLAVLCQPPFRWIERKIAGRTRLAAGLTTVLLSVLLIAPLVIGTIIASIELIQFTHQLLAKQPLVVRDAAGDEYRFEIAPNVEVLLDDEFARITDLEEGDRVVVWPAEQRPGTVRTIRARREIIPDEVGSPIPRGGIHGELVHTGASRWNRTVARLQRDFDLDGIAAMLRPYLGDEFDAARLEAQFQSGLQTGLRNLALKTFGIAGAAIGFIGSFAGGLISLLMFVIAFYYFLADGPELLAASETLIPVKVDYQRQILDQFTRAVRAVVTATFFAAIAQGFATSVALQFFGFGHFFLFLTIGTLTAMIPMLGTWVVWGPCAVWLAWQGHWLQAGVLTVFGSVVIGMLDNVIRTYVLHSDVRLHPLLAFVSVLGGLQALGLWGVFIGPIVASCLHALVQIFNTELREFSRERFPPPPGEQVVAPPAPPAAEAPPDNDTETATSSAAYVATPTPPRSRRRRSRKR